MKRPNLTFRLDSLIGRCFSSRTFGRRSRLVAMARTASRHRTGRDKDANNREYQRSKHSLILCHVFSPQKLG